LGARGRRADEKKKTRQLREFLLVVARTASRNLRRGARTQLSMWWSGIGRPYVCRTKERGLVSAGTTRGLDEQGAAHGSSEALAQASPKREEVTPSGGRFWITAGWSLRGTVVFSPHDECWPLELPQLCPWKTGDTRPSPVVPAVECWHQWRPCASFPSSKALVQISITSGILFRLLLHAHQGVLY
jgi:hypothetical protein